jgi:hypothetical protein
VKRIQLSRKKGWRMPANTLKVDRTTKWSNPFIVGKHGTRAECVDMHAKLMAGYLCISVDHECIEAQRAHLAYVKANRRHLKGKNLACWCPPGPCHADILLKVRHS